MPAKKTTTTKPAATKPAAEKCAKCSDLESQVVELTRQVATAGASEREVLEGEKNEAVSRSNDLAIELGKSEGRNDDLAKKLQKFAEQEGTLTVI